MVRIGVIHAAGDHGLPQDDGSSGTDSYLPENRTSSPGGVLRSREITDIYSHVQAEGRLPRYQLHRDAGSNIKVLELSILGFDGDARADLELLWSALVGQVHRVFPAIYFLALRQFVD